MAEYISKNDFARRCGVSVPTVYAWIEKNKGDIRAYIKGAKIDAAIFRSESWGAYQIASETERDARRAAELSAELDAARKEIDAQRAALEIANKTITAQAEQIAAKDQHIEDIRAQLAAKDTQIQALLVTMNKQLQALPSPRKTIWEKWAERRAARKDKQTNGDNIGA